ncbi:MAG: CHC2 zinc finger domain-containing protein [Pseudomonadota bacterium]
MPKSNFIDFEEVKAQNPIADVAQQLGLELKKAGNALRGPCPSGEGGERGLVITPSKGVWYSFPLQKGGDVLALVQLIKDCSTKEAAQFLSGTAPLEKAKRPSPGEGSEARGGFAPLTYLEHDHLAVSALGLEPEDAQALGIGYAPRGTMRGTVAVPIRTEDGTLAGYIGITEAKLPPKWEV